MAFLGWQFWSSMTVNFRNGTIGPSIAEVPVWIPEAILLLGIAVFLIQIIAQILMFLLSEKIETETQQSSGV
jgi:TRAP-type mannitol/chloroaromatic compound transport system permease small subunit